MTVPTPPPAAVAAIVEQATTALDQRVGTMFVNGNSQYRDPVETWQRVSTLLKNLKTEADSKQLTDWKLRQVALGLATRPDLVLGVAAAKQLGPDGKLTWESKSKINELCRQAGDVAGNKAGANQGTAVHTATERLDLGESIEAIGLPYPFSADLAAYAKLKQAMRLTFRPEHIERSVRTKEVGTVGTYDRVGECEWLVEQGMLAPDESIVVDVKTEGDPLLNLIHIAPQIATYANADAQFIPDPAPAREARAAGRVPTTEELAAGTYEPMPNVSKTIGLVIHVRDGKAVPYLVDLVAGWEAARAAAAQRDRVKASKIKLGEPGCWAVLLDAPISGLDALVQDRTSPRLAADRLKSIAPPADCLNCEPLVHGASSTRVDGSEPTDSCLTCGADPIARPAPVETAVVEQAVRGPDGMVTWHVVPAAPEPAPAASWRDLLAAVEVSPDLADLARLYDLAQQHGIEWGGPIAEAGAVRQGVVQCPQRALHTSGGACACGWREGMAP